jgi:hypothetical protein
MNLLFFIGHLHFVIPISPEKYCLAFEEVIKGTKFESRDSSLLLQVSL